MKRAGFIFTSLLFFTLASSVNAGNASFRLESKINANSINSTTYSNDTHVKVDIDQEGNGTSIVTFNGETWKQEGQGEIHVDKNSSSSPNPAPDSSPNSSPSTDPSPSPDPSASPDPTPSPSASPEPNNEGIAWAISEFLENIKEFFNNLF